MQKEKVIFWSVGVTMVLALIGAGIYIAVVATRSSGKNISSQVKGSRSTVVSGESSGSTLAVGDNAGIGGGLQAEGQQLTSDKPSSSSSKAEDLSIYDKYRSEKAALFGDIKVGTGAEAVVDKKVSLYYVGKFTDGQIFDQILPSSSDKQPKPLSFALGSNNIIVGLQQGVAGMKVGGKRRIVVPPSVGYGEKGTEVIPANTVMVFDVELLAVE